MAAEAIASVVLGRLASVTLNKLEEHFQLAMGDQNEVKKLTNSFQAIQALLYDAEIKKITNATANVGVTLWLQRFRDVAYKMDDIIDHWITETLISQIALRHEIVVEIKELRKELDDIISDKNKLSLKSYLPAANEHPAGERLPTSSIIDESEIFSRHQDKKMISSMLLDANTPTNPFIISIIGMGGLGKTALAQLVYNQDGMKNHFDTVIWVSVSDYFDQSRIAKEIIRGAGDHVPGHLSEWNDELHKLLCESVKKTKFLLVHKKRFLLVLDDMWTEDNSKWEPFKLAFKEAAPGSRILVTTRKQSVADMIGSNYSHLLEDNCWQLLSRLAFDGKNADKKRNEAWINIGKAIAKRCKGVPLSAKVLGNLLRVKEDISEWQTVMDNKSIWELEDGILKPALLLSYYDLPPPVRACFVYCSIFPKGHKILKDELIGLWMAQGLIVSTEGEAVGREYFNRLAARSFFQNFMLDLDGNIISCDMHDLVHDFAQFLTQGEYLTSSDTSSSSNIQEFPRHLSLFCSEGLSVNPDFLRSFISHAHGEKKNLRTFLVVNRPMSCCSIIRMRTILPDLLHHLRYLRVLVIRHSDLEFLPSEIEKLIHLRYLGLPGNFYLTGLPDSLCNLYNLQTLNVSHCSELRKLPDELGRMINLRHLQFESTGSLECLPQGIGNLVSLHTLTEFRIRVGEGISLKLLKNLNQLEGHLSISGLDLVQNSEDAYEAMLNNKKKLQSLLFNFAVTKIESEDSDDKDFEIAPVKTVVDVLASLEPPSLLGKLKIMNYRGSKLSNWIEMLSNLRNLELDHCNCVELPALGKLPSLEHLSIVDMHQLKRIGPEFYGGCHGHWVAFPQLKTLRISKAHCLVEFTLMSSGGFPLLHQVELDDCINLTALPAFGKLPSLECLEISGLHNVKHIGTEFYGDGAEFHGHCVAFPQLKTLRISQAHGLVDFTVTSSRGGFNIFPLLHEVELDDCRNLKALPAFGKQPSLECLKISGMHNVRHIGTEFYGDDADSVPFPNLKKLVIQGAYMLEEWDILGMPFLGKLELDECINLKALPAFGKLPSLECLEISGPDKLKHIGSEFYGDGADSVPFPKLEKLSIRGAHRLEEWDTPATLGMPFLRELELHDFMSLKALPSFGKLPSLSHDYLYA